VHHCKNIQFVLCKIAIVIIFLKEKVNKLVNIAKIVQLIQKNLRGTNSNGDWCDDL